EHLAGRHLHPDPGRLRLHLRARFGRDALCRLQDAKGGRAGFDDTGRHAGDVESPPPIDVTLGAPMRWAWSWLAASIVAVVLAAPLARGAAGAANQDAPSSAAGAA